MARWGCGRIDVRNYKIKLTQKLQLRHFGDRPIAMNLNKSLDLVSTVTCAKFVSDRSGLRFLSRQTPENRPLPLEVTSPIQLQHYYRCAMGQVCVKNNEVNDCVGTTQLCVCSRTCANIYLATKYWLQSAFVILNMKDARFIRMRPKTCMSK